LNLLEKLASLQVTEDSMQAYHGQYNITNTLKAARYDNVIFNEIIKLYRRSVKISFLVTVYD